MLEGVEEVVMVQLDLEVEVQVVGYTDEELRERAVAEALAAARALGRMWRKRFTRVQRLERLGRMGVHVPPPPSEAESRSIVDALIKTTLAGGFKVVRRATGWMRQRMARCSTPVTCCFHAG